MSEAKARDSKFEHIGEISPFVSEPYHFSYWCGSFLFVRLIPGQYFTAYKYGKDKYDKFPYKNESFLNQPDCKTYDNPQKPEHQLQEQHTYNKYRQ